MATSIRSATSSERRSAVAPAADIGIAGCQNLAQHAQSECRGPLHRPLDIAMGGVPRQIVERCILPSADSRRRIVVGAWLAARLAR
jgi:hypothetical protein